MPDLGKYAVEVLLSYGVTIGLIGALVCLTWYQSRKAKQRLEQLEDD